MYKLVGGDANVPTRASFCIQIPLESLLLELSTQYMFSRVTNKIATLYQIKPTIGDLVCVYLSVSTHKDSDQTERMPWLIRVIEVHNRPIAGFVTVRLTYAIIGVFRQENITQTRPCNILQYFTAVKMIIFR